jgi:hypothetical protein
LPVIEYMVFVQTDHLSSQSPSSVKPP